MTLSGTWTNDGSLVAANGCTLVLNLSNAWQNAGTITENSGTIDLGGAFDTSIVGTITGVGGLINFTGTLTNDGTLTLDGSGIAPQYSLLGGTISGGTISTPGGGELVATRSGGILDDVTLAGTLFVGQVISTFIDVRDNLTLENGTVTMQGNGALDFLGSQTLGGPGTVDFADNPPTENQKGLYVPDAGDTLTIASGVLIHGNAGFLGNASGGLVTLGGTIAADGSGTITLQGFTNFAGGTLTGGTWKAVGVGTLRLLGANVSTNAASIVLDGASATIDSSTGTTSALAGLITNVASASFTLQDGAQFVSAAPFTNAGTLTVASARTFGLAALGATYTQTGGTTNLSSGTLGTTGNQIDITGGTLSGTGTINGNLTNGSDVDLGSSPGTLAISGNYTQSSAGTLDLKIGGATAGTLFDQVNITGTAALSGTLNVSFTNGFAPGSEESFDVMNFAGSSGSFLTFHFPSIDGSPALITNAMQTSLNLIAVTTAPDLAASDVSFTPAQALLGGMITVDYSVTNLGTVATTAGSWTDSVYLSTTTTVDANAVAAGPGHAHRQLECARELLGIADRKPARRHDRRLSRDRRHRQRLAGARPQPGR